MSESPGALELLSSRVDELEKRVYGLEHPGEARSHAAVEAVAHSKQDAGDGAVQLESGNFFPILGRAMLGIAGAYVLRAIAEAGVLPRLPVSAFAVTYAFAWLVWSSRTSGTLARLVYAGASVLILAPLLWENTLKLQLFAPVASAGVLASFMALATVLELRKNTRTGGAWIAQSVAVVTTAALGFATHRVLPFIVALLIALFVSEIARMQQLAQPVWALMVLVADAALWALIFIYAGPQDARAAYPELSSSALIALACALFAISGLSVAVRVARYESRISVFETIQLMIAFLLAVGAVLYFAPQAGVTILGVCCLALSGCLYLASFRYLRGFSDRRDLRVFSAWSAALLMAGSLWSLSRTGAAILMAIAAVAAIYSAARMEPEILKLHGVAFLLGAVSASGFPRYIFDVLAGSPAHHPAAALWIVSVCAVLTSLLIGRTVEDAWQKALEFVPVLVAVSALIAFFVHGVLAGIAMVITMDAHHIAFLRTFTMCLASLALAFGGSRWGRTELTHLAYVVLAFVAAKLLFEDLRHGHMEFTAGSIALFAIALIAAPRLVRLGARNRGIDSGIATQSPGLPPLPR